MLDVRLYLAQRISAMVMVPLVFGHLAVLIYAIQGGLDAAEILSRTQGSLWWGSFYGLFVIAVSIHAAIGLRVVAHEYLKLTGGVLSAFTLIVGLTSLGMGGPRRIRGGDVMVKPHRNHPLWFAYIVHRLSGVCLALFLPAHFYVLGLALKGAAELDAILNWTENLLVKLAEVGLVFLLAVHFFGGLRLLAVEFLPWSPRQKTYAAMATAVSFFVAGSFFMNAI